jgi:hypothetical protein
MFSFFSKKELETKVVDRVFISSTAKQAAVREQLRNNQSITILTWFEESYDLIQTLIKSNNLQAEIYLPREIAAHNIRGKAVLFLEHYPLINKEKKLLEKLQLKEAIFYSALDEPIFKHFGGGHIISMMEKLGLSENEAIEHPMISSAIKNAQEKISKNVTIDHSALSQADWFSKNIVK